MKIARYRRLTPAEQELVTTNVRLAYALAQKSACAASQALTTDSPAQRQQFFADFASAGLEGLCIAAQRFDPARGLRFSTYATWWIRSRIGDARMACLLTVGRPVRGGPKVATVCLLSDHTRDQDGEWHDDNSPIDVLDCRAPVPAPTEMDTLLAPHLPPRLCEIVVRRYAQDQTYSQIALAIGRSKERVRQLLGKALVKLRLCPAALEALEQATRQHATGVRPRHIATLVV